MHKSVAVLNGLIYLEDLAKICLLILMSLDFPCVLVPNAVVTCFISAIVFASGTIAKRLVASLFCSSGRLEKIVFIHNHEESILNPSLQICSILVKVFMLFTWWGAFSSISLKQEQSKQLSLKPRTCREQNGRVARIIPS